MTAQKEHRMYASKAKSTWLKHMSFQEISIKSKVWPGLSVELGWDCHEGYDGEYNVNDPEDEPFLRFDVCWSKGANGEQLENASYCTQLLAYEDRDLLKRAAAAILEEAEQTFLPAKDGDMPSVGKRAMEYMSWIAIRDGAVKLRGE